MYSEYWDWSDTRQKARGKGRIGAGSSRLPLLHDDYLFPLTSTKQAHLRRMVGSLLQQAEKGAGVILDFFFTTLCEAAVSLRLAVPLARFLSRSPYECFIYFWREREKSRGSD